jgi:spore coat-associated protein N
VIRVITIAAVLGAVGGAGGGTLAATVHNEQGTSAPKEALVLGRAAAFTVPGVGLAAGDVMQRPLDLKNRGNVPFSAVALTTSASPASALDSDTVDGLHLRVDSCPGSWRKDKRTKQYACKKLPTNLVGLRPLLGDNMVLQGLGIRKGKTVHLLLTVSLPATAPNALQGKTSTVTYTFTAG